MILTGVLVAISAVAAAADDPKVEWRAPGAFLAGGEFKVELAVTAGSGGAKLDSWMLTAAAFELDGKPLAERSGGKLDLPAGFTVSGVIDLGPLLKANGAFKLAHAAKQKEPLSVNVLTPAPKDLKFMDEAAMPATELSKYNVLLQTNRGDILVKFWPEVAPRHVRNFLDLSSIGFYDGTIFHRVMPGFMIQGGDPTGSGTGDGPRTLKAEFSQKDHVPGVLSMARGPSPDSASCQFFVMHGVASHLNGQYSAFGETVWGLEVVDKIAMAPGRPIPGAGGNRPDQPQKLERAIVVLAPKK